MSGQIVPIQTESKVAVSGLQCGVEHCREKQNAARAFHGAYSELHDAIYLSCYSKQ